MRKKYVLSFIYFLFSVVNGYALDEQIVKVTQSVAAPKEAYSPFTTPTLPVGIINLKYDFVVKAKDNAHAAIDLLIKFPKNLNVELVSCDGIQAIELKEDETVPAFAIYEEENNKYCEFLIPQKNEGTGFVEFQLNISEELKDKDILVEFKFKHLQKPFLLRYGTAIGIATGIAAGVVVGVLTFNPATGAAAGAATGSAVATTVVGGTAVATTTGITIGLGGAIAIGAVAGGAVAAGTTYVSYEVIRESLQEMKKKYSSKNMNDSYKRFTLQIR